LQPTTNNKQNLPSSLLRFKKLAKGLTGKLFGDRGYLSKKLFDELLQEGIQLITTVRKNMKNRLIPIMDKLLLRKRFIIETINDQLKNISQIERGCLSTPGIEA
jgi:hypothetical protein